MYFHDGVDETHSNAPKPRGEGAYGFSGQAQVIRFAGTELSAWVDCVAELIKTEFPYEEDFRIQIDGVTWRCCRDTNSASSEISMRQIVTEIPRLADLTTDNNALVNLMQHSFLNDGGLVLIGGLPGSGKVTTIHSENSISSIRRLAGMASTRLGSVADLLLAASLRLSIHSSLDWRAGKTDARTARSKAIMSLNALFSSGESHPVATHIRERKYSQINQSVENQRGIFTRASNAGSPASHIYEQLGGSEK